MADVPPTVELAKVGLQSAARFPGTVTEEDQLVIGQLFSLASSSRLQLPKEGLHVVRIAGSLWMKPSKSIQAGASAPELDPSLRTIAKMARKTRGGRQVVSRGSTAGGAILVLEDGRVFRGESYGAAGETFGEAVFSTGMTGYQETLTDPSYHRQVVVMTSPHVGNTGMNDDDPESRRIWVSGYVVRDPARAPSNWRSVRSLDDELREQGVVGISGIDTRALTRHLRERGAMRVGISSTATDPEDLLARVQGSAEMAGSELAGEVSTTEAYVVPAVGEKRFTVAAVDLGIKANTPRMMAERGIEVHVLPATSSLEQVLATRPDGLFFSNGPGDPAATISQVELLRGALDAGLPYFGICFGNQLFGRALGFGTYKLKYGHRGINQPVMDRTTGKVEVTSHNHGFAVDAPLEGSTETPYGEVTVSHLCLNDDVVEGLELRSSSGDLLSFSVQYHPEAAAGPHDAAYLFDRFCGLMAGEPPAAGGPAAPPEHSGSASGVSTSATDLPEDGA